VEEEVVVKVDEKAELVKQQLHVSVEDARERQAALERMQRGRTVGTQVEGACGAGDELKGCGVGDGLKGCGAGA